MVSATSERTIYIFIVKTTRQQDLDLIARFNAAPNVNHFNGFSRNCADFSKHIINTYFPHATHRDALNDFGMTSPKAVARTLAGYAHHHPELEYRVVHFAQSPGTLKHSSECRSGPNNSIARKSFSFRWLFSPGTLCPLWRDRTF